MFRAGDYRPGLVQVKANWDGLTLKRVFWRDLPVCGGIGRPATVLLEMRADPENPEFFICETRDVILDAEPPRESAIDWQPYS